MSWICPIHGQEKVRQGPKGVFCSGKMPDGSWCKERPPRTAPAAVSAPAANGEALQAAALNFAANIYRGAGPELADDAIALALRAYTAFKAVQP